MAALMLVAIGALLPATSVAAIVTATGPLTAARTEVHELRGCLHLMDPPGKQLLVSQFAVGGGTPPSLDQLALTKHTLVTTLAAQESAALTRLQALARTTNCETTKLGRTSTATDTAAASIPHTATATSHATGLAARHNRVSDALNAALAPRSWTSPSVFIPLIVALCAVLGLVAGLYRELRTRRRW